MTLGAAIFASVVLVLLVYNKPFRKASAWIAAIALGLALVIGLGWYAYVKYQDHAQAKQAEAHKKLVDACVERFSKSDYRKSDELAKYLDERTSCEHDPNTDWGNKSTEHGPWEKYAPETLPGDFFDDKRTLLIRGGETLKVVHPVNANNKSQFDMTKSIPIIYLGHKQSVGILCGNFGESGTEATVSKGTVSCP